MRGITAVIIPPPVLRSLPASRFLLLDTLNISAILLLLLLSPTLRAKRETLRPLLPPPPPLTPSFLHPPPGLTYSGGVKGPSFASVVLLSSVPSCRLDSALLSATLPSPAETVRPATLPNHETAKQARASEVCAKASVGVSREKRSLQPHVCCGEEEGRPERGGSEHERLVVVGRK